ncbi:MAG: hypothetical protein MPN21_13610, partial [Thermoanaerobaculia bacterium]|nr:hypothetical protein [Thermoanaerobaculia bacterium]
MHRTTVLAPDFVLVAVSCLMTVPAFGSGDPGAARGEMSPIMAAYDFEEDHPSGPDTFWVREEGDLRVDLSAAFRTSGERSLRIEDVAGDRDFAEFLGYLEERVDGAVFWQFYVLFTDPGDTHNFGISGVEWFLDRSLHGQAFWLQVKDGHLRHHEAEGWSDLITVEPFRWYFVDWLYDIDRGRYDLRIFGEGEEKPLVDVRDAMNYTGEVGSSVRYFSFIGDLDDATDPTYFVDDVLFAADPELRLAPFVAPGRRQLFVDRWRRAPLEKKGLADRVHAAQRLLARVNVDDLDETQIQQIESAADHLVAARRLEEAGA